MNGKSKYSIAGGIPTDFLQLADINKDYHFNRIKNLKILMQERKTTYFDNETPELLRVTSFQLHSECLCLSLNLRTFYVKFVYIFSVGFYTLSLDPKLFL